MKKFSILILFQGILSVIIGLLFSKMSWLGKIGISLFHSEYKILKIWWKSALVVFGLQLLLILIFCLFKRFCSKKMSILLLILFLLCGITGAYFTYLDFTHTYEHRILKDKFHLGGYLFWTGWITTNLFFLFSPYRKNKIIEESEEQKIME